MITASVSPEQADRLRRKRRGIEELELLVKGISELITEERQGFAGTVADTFGVPVGDLHISTQPCSAPGAGVCVHLDAADSTCLFCGTAN